MMQKSSSTLISSLHLSGIMIEHLSALPCHVYWKDKKGFYLGYNDYGAERLGFKGEEIGGHSDFEIFPRSVATEFTRNDQKVILGKEKMFVHEDGVLKKGLLKVVFISYKMPVFDYNESLVGILGISFTRPPKNHYSSTQLEQDFNYYPPVEQHNKALSKMENACMHHLCSGLTTKQIARRLNLSPRTVETYIERSKIKYNCQNKAELMWIMIKNFPTLT